MLRFLPDGWLEGLLRPLLLADPATGLYFEMSAPDWRFVLLALFLLIGLVARRGRLGFTTEQWTAVTGLIVAFYVWTFVVGNGRYFLWGLLLVGPLVVVAWRQVPGTRAFRLMLLALAVALQVFTVSENYQPNRWSLAKWRNGPSLPLPDSPLRHQPAVFLTFTGISYSILVPRFHPQSRWANIAGQRNITPGSLEDTRLRAMLDSPLPRYVVAPLHEKFMDEHGQPSSVLRDMIDITLAPHGMALSGQACTLLRMQPSLGSADDFGPARGFWFCPAEPRRKNAVVPVVTLPVPADRINVFERIERRCPRFFPPGDGVDNHFEGLSTRLYPSSDVKVYIDDHDLVLYRYFRAVNPTVVGTKSQVLRGDFKIACDKLPGRYQLPWSSN